MSTFELAWLAPLALVSGILALICLVVLHVVSPEFQPSWRMISEYAMGKYKGLITAFFYLWGISSFFLSVLLWNEVTTGWGVLGVVLLFISAIGEIMGGLFDVKHKLHGFAFLLGVPAMPLAALLIGYNLVDQEGWNNNLLLFASHATWLSLVAMAIAMGVMMAGFRKAGIAMDQNTPPPEKVPEGVLAVAGYANRLLVLCYVGWLLVVSFLFLSQRT